MSFWNHIKPAPRTPVATAANLSASGDALALTWDDGVQFTVPARALRQACPCAECVEEWSGRRTFAPDSISVDTRVLEVQQVGNYALSFVFSDQHSTGIFTWPILRALSA